ncbi:Plasmid pRiA4b ORF-3-like protein [Symmachiella dynata]|nr:Plasmid pRiA4b ORF-3-like protein [Symmachiella dynata]
MSEPTLNARFTHAQRRVVGELMPHLADQLLLDTSNQRTLAFALEELEAIQQKAHEAIRHAANGIVRNSLRHIIDATTKAIENSEGIGVISSSERLYQFKITLMDWEPLIWRRIQVKNSTLDKFHEHIQSAMGWTNSHLHQFEIDGERYGDPEILDDGFADFHCVDSTVTKISAIVPKDGSRFGFIYQYDFGDNWVHEVVFEGCLCTDPGQRYPLCLEGESACPPEDIGGVWGYAEFLEVIGDPKHEQHQEFLEWRGPFAPEEFDAGKTTKLMRRGLPDWRQSL